MVKSAYGKKKHLLLQPIVITICVLISINNVYMICRIYILQYL